MPDTDIVTFQQTPPRLPTIDDLHSGLLQNVPGKPPGPDHPNALAFNQSDKLVVALANVAAAVKLYITFPGGTPTIQSISSLRTGLLAADFTLTVNAAGDTSIIHTGGKLIGLRWPATVLQVDDVEIDRIRAVPIAGGVRVKTKLGSVGTDCAIVVELSGV